MNTLRRQPVSRPKVALGALAGAIVLAAIVLLAEWLRPGAGLGASPITPELDADPRVAVACEAPHPREGLRPAAPANPRAVEVTSTQLYDCPTTWDGRAVRFTGEAVGGVLRRGDEAWLQLNDDPYSGEGGPLPFHRDFRGGNGGVGVLVPATLADRIESVGGPRRRGDVVQIAGVFHRVDAATSEVAIIRAVELTVLRRGEPVTAPVEPRRVAVAAILGTLAGALLLVHAQVRRRR